MTNDINLDKVQLSWTTDILRRIDDILKSDNQDSDKINMIKWLVKQALKVERED